MTKIKYNGFEINSEDLIEDFKHILKTEDVADRDARFIESIISKLENESTLSEKQIKYCRDIIMKYSKKYVSSKTTVSLDVKKEDIEWAKNEISEFEKTEKGKWRYAGVEAWRGILGERLVFLWLSRQFPGTEKNDDISKCEDYDSYDFIINSFKIDVKCATEWMHASITPKVNTCKLWKKDIYIGCKYDERSQPEKVVIMGWVYGKELDKFPVLKDKGTEYYEIPITELKDIKKLLEILKSEQKH